MSALADDTVATPPARTASGIGFALGAALSFALSGPLAKGLIETGWSPGAAVTARVLIGAAILLVPAIVVMRGRWHLLRRNLGLVVLFGIVPVAGVQLSFFNAIDRMPVGVALLVEFASPVVVIGWLWLRHAQRPGRLTVTGAVVTIVGLALVLDLLSGVSLDGIGLTWAVAAMVCVAVYWIISADERGGLPGFVLAAGGLLVGGTTLLVAGLVGIIPLAASTDDVVLEGITTPWWLAVLVLGAVTAALPYVLGIAGIRRLGSRLASFVGLAEAVAGVGFAWLLLGETPRSIQLVGGVLILAGVVAVRLGEPRVAAAPVVVTTP